MGLWRNILFILKFANRRIKSDYLKHLNFWFLLTWVQGNQPYTLFPCILIHQSSFPKHWLEFVSEILIKYLEDRLVHSYTNNAVKTVLVESATLQLIFHLNWHGQNWISQQFTFHQEIMSVQSTISSYKGLNENEWFYKPSNDVISNKALTTQWKVQICHSEKRFLFAGSAIMEICISFYYLNVWVLIIVKAPSTKTYGHWP